MALQVYADERLVFDSRLEQYKLLGLKTTSGLNKSGTAELIMPPGHPAYNFFTSYKTVVTLRENGVLRWRGRALYPADDFYTCRTITCEGERGFLRDGVMRPYLYQTTPAAIFAAGLEIYNAQVDAFKRFKLGTVTVTDPNGYVRLESESAENCNAFFTKLVDRCGGYITFSDDEDGNRCMNWLADVGTVSTQGIEFGTNLLEFALSGQTDELATVLVPYGAQLESGKRVTIAGVNGGQDWIQDDEAVALRGRIVATVTWDDVTVPANLLTKAQQWLAEHKKAVTALQLTAVDLSRLDRSMATYNDGDLVPVRSKPHGVDENFQLTDRTIDWLNPDGGNVTLGKSRASLTGADAMVERDVNAKIVILNNAVINGQIQTQELQRTLTSKIEQLAGSITLEVSGGLGNSAAIRLNVDGNSYTESLDLSEVRKAFANDPSSITLEAGTITFNSNTLVVNSSHFTLDSAGKITATAGTIGAWNIMPSGILGSAVKNSAGTFYGVAVDPTVTAFNNNLTVFAIGKMTPSSGSEAADALQGSWSEAAFRVTAAGKLYATDAVIFGTVTTISSYYKAQLDSGGLELYYNDDLCGQIDTRYHNAQQEDGRGIALRVEGKGKYIMFCAPYDDTGRMLVDYYLNAGFSSSYDERHIFQSSARFLDPVYFSGHLYMHSAYLYEGYFIKTVDSSGNVGHELLGFQDSNFRVCVGSNYCTTMLRGTTVYLKDTSTTVTSDRNAKHDIEELPAAYEAFVDALQPVRFKYNEGSSGRYHVGFIAQDVEAALTEAGLTTQDFAGYVDIDHTGELGLQYTEFVAVLLQKIKRLEQRVNALQAVN